MPTDRFIYFLHSDQSVILWGWDPRGLYDPEIRTWSRLFDNASTQQVSSSHFIVWKLSCWRKKLKIKIQCSSEEMTPTGMDIIPRAVSEADLYISGWLRGIKVRWRIVWEATASRRQCRRRRCRCRWYHRLRWHPVTQDTQLCC